METNSDKIINSFKDANKSLRKRAITIGVLMILAIGLTYIESVRLKSVMELLNYQYKLEEINKLPDNAFQKVIAGDDELKYFPYIQWNSANSEHAKLFEKIKADSLRRTLIPEAIDDIDKKIEDLNKEKSIAILGLTIPIQPVTYISIIIILILFHDFAQVIVYRNQVYREIRKLKVPNWELGFESFGFYNNSNNSANKFLRFTSSIIAGLLMICPLITSFLMLSFNNTNSAFLGIVNIVCFSLIIIDTMIVFYTENVWNFRFYSNRYLGKHNISKTRLRIMWIFPLIYISAFHFGISMELKGSSLAKIMYLFLSCVPFLPLYFFLERAYNKPTRINRALRGGALMVSVFWTFAMFHNAFTFEDWEYYKLWDMADMLIIAYLISAFISFVYMKYFMIQNLRH